MTMYPKGDGMFEAHPTQNTHWYKTGGEARAGWTSDPRQAPQSEVERVGFHDCEELGCGIMHSNTKKDYDEKEDE